METRDFLVVGGGVMGLSIARALKRARPGASVLLCDKEDGPDRHASGRNSGVLHAGFYYSPDSLKARFTREGNAAWREYAKRKGLPLLECGKLVAASRDEELPRLAELLRRGRAAGVELHELSADEARRREPRARVHRRALFSPATAVLDPAAAVRALAADAAAEGVELRWSSPWEGVERGAALVGGRAVDAGFTINAAGLHADRVARAYGFSRNYRILPFKGLYLYSSEPAGAFKTLVYPVPDPAYPFLGVHLTLTVDGRVKLGPTALPALWRESYGGLGGWRVSETVEILARQARLLLTGGAGFARLAGEELVKRSRTAMVARARLLLEGLRDEDFATWGKPGVRAQLIDVRDSKLVMDFVLEGDSRSLHVLNAVSPGFTCAMPFAAHVVERALSAGR